MSDKNDHEHDLVGTRREKLARWRDLGGVYPNDFRRTALAADLHAAHEHEDKAALESAAIEVSVCGRVMLRRVMGKASFVTLQDGSGRIQCYIREDDVGAESYGQFDSLWDIGDIVGVEGVLMRTNKGELTVAAKRVVLLNKTIRPLPEKFHGLTDQETKYRQRYLDLLMNAESRRVFETRSRIVRALREFFEAHGFMEVETPMMHHIPGGATARPFVTHHNTLDMELYLRVAPELFLKRLVVGGFEKVFEINRNFRNEGLSTRHNPEFTMLEFYWAYRSFEDLIELTQEMLRFVAVRVTGSARVAYQGIELDFESPVERMTMAQAIVRHTSVTEADLGDPAALRAYLSSRNLAAELDWNSSRLMLEIFEAEVEERLVQPVFVTQYPTEVSPLSRRNDVSPAFADRFELFICGREIANGFSELNDPDDQAARFRAQLEAKARGDLEAMGYDEDYVTALEYGLPPTAGEGIGIDRLVMLLTDTTSIRDVLLFPLMRPRDG